MLGERYIRVLYEDLVADHRRISSRILDHVELEWNPRFGRIADVYPIMKNANRKYESRLSNAQKAMIKEITTPTLCGGWIMPTGSSGT